MDTPSRLTSRIAALLRAVSAHEPDGATTTELATAADLSRPTAHRLLVALHDEGLVDRSSDAHWHVGPELYLLRTSAAARYDVTETARRHLRHLSLVSGESAFFSARRGSETVCLVGEEGSFPLRSHVLHEGKRFPLGVASAGLVILAYLPATETSDYLGRAALDEAFGPEHHRDRVLARLRQTRSVGYSVNPGLVVPGSWGLGAAVFDDTGQPQWALSLTGVHSRFTRDRRRRLGPLLLQAAHDLALDIRNSKGPKANQ